MYKNKLNKILLNDEPSKELYKLIENGEMKDIIPELIKLKGFNQHTPYHDKDILDHTMTVVDSIKPKLILRMAALLHDISKPDCFTIDEKGRGHFYGHHIKSANESEIILQRLGYGEEFIENVQILIRYHYIKDINKNIKEKGIEKFIDDVGENRLEDILELIKADIMGKSDSNNFDVINKLKQMINDYIKKDIEQ
ncbi:HD domain-containing protein [Sedimentibacter sp. MB31-C6]|uniref:HD domain-containing protein n=1 Tax=Sedimentibacter sp. MB31-C6 TaxID=3109366 RepID=UPI002DDD395C|nr:HD domain-containing protein [Sedimentibacter sp. MB36-C1]WSI05033.1 HD domain-containing protein [Sedimentibacter sp. MB36-C1]